MLGSAVAVVLYGAAGRWGGAARRGAEAEFVSDDAAAYAYGTATEEFSGMKLDAFARALSRVVIADVGAEMGEAPRTSGAAPRRRADGFVRVVATHHKTGTALMRDVLETISRNYSFFDVRAAEDRAERSSEEEDETSRSMFTNADIVFDYHFGKRLPKYLISDARERSLESIISTSNALDYRIVHVVRNPPDVIVSGAAYHRRAPLDENWLTPFADVLSNATPKVAISAEMSFSDDELRMLALAHVECAVDRKCLNVRLEELESNFDAVLARALLFLEFPSSKVRTMVRAASVHDMKQWSDDELRQNEHYTKKSDRSAYYRAISSDAMISETLMHLQKAMNYTVSER
ncbi:hypothetical protein BE221DRAFT_80888 [Ostreococcus tauri]|nr:hypothetical protein BE221DRAFT_80888 [Ostreococcus tauri]